MTNLEKYKNAFVEGLELSIDEVTEELEYQGIPQWDSVGHMAVEEEDCLNLIGRI